MTPTAGFIVACGTLLAVALAVVVYAVIHEARIREERRK